jgi:hypothetical protein
LKQRWVAAKEWDTFEGEATCWTVLAGAASIEELRVPARGFSGLGIRLLDVNKHLWADYWVSSRDGVLTPPPMWGSFESGVGTFVAAGTRPPRATAAKRGRKIGSWIGRALKNATWGNTKCRQLV